MMMAADEEAQEGEISSQQVETAAIMTPLFEGEDHPLAIDTEQPDEEQPFASLSVESDSTPDEGTVLFMQEDTSVFEGYSTHAEEDEIDNADANPDVAIPGEDDAETNENDNIGQNRDISASNNEIDLELGLPLADLDSDNEDDGITEGTDQDALARRRSTSFQRRTLYWMRFVLHIVFFPVLVITSVAIPVLIVMFCFALMFVAMVVLLCVYYCCSPRRGDQAAVPFHVLIRQILEAVEDETHGLGEHGNDTPKHSREEIQNALVRRKLVHFECSDVGGNVVEDPDPQDEATREERMHQDMFPDASQLEKPLIPAANNNPDDEEEEPKATGFKGIRRRLSARKRKQKNSVIDHNKSYELRMANQKITFSTDPAVNHSKLFLVKRTFVFSPPLDPAKIKPANNNDDEINDNDFFDNDIADNGLTDEETRNYNLAVAALEEDDSSSPSSSSRFLQMLAEFSSESSSSDSANQSSDVSFLSESSGQAESNHPPLDDVEIDNSSAHESFHRDIVAEENLLTAHDIEAVNSPMAEGSSPMVDDASSPVVVASDPVADLPSPPIENPTLASETHLPASEASSVMLPALEQTNAQQESEPQNPASEVSSGTTVLPNSPPASDPVCPSSEADDIISNCADDILDVDLDAVLDAESGAGVVFDSPSLDQNAPNADTEPPDDSANASGVNGETSAADAPMSSENVDTAPESACPLAELKSEESNNFESVPSGLVPLTPPMPPQTSEDAQLGATPQTEPPKSEVVSPHSLDEYQGDNQLASSPGLASDVVPRSFIEDMASADVASPSSLMIHPAFIPLEETKMEITQRESSEETKTEIDAYEGEIHGPSPGPAGMESTVEGATPLDPVMTDPPTNDIAASNDSTADAVQESAAASKGPAETPEHRGISSTCNICLLEYEVGDIVVWSRRPHGCHHAWHEDCLLDWLQRKPTCPNCRQEFFAIEDAPQQQETPPAEDNDNGLGEGNHTIVPESQSTHSIPVESGHSRRFW